MHDRGKGIQLPQMNMEMTAAQSELAQMILERPAAQRSMPKGRKADKIDCQLIAKNVINEDRYKPDVMQPIQAVASTLGCSNEEAVTRTLVMVVI